MIRSQMHHTSAAASSSSALGGSTPPSTHHGSGGGGGDPSSGGSFGGSPLPGGTSSTIAILASTTGGDDEKKKLEGPVAARESSLPLYQSGSLAAIYIIISVSLFLLIRHSKQLEAKNPDIKVYDSAAAVFFVELCKWTFSVGMMYHRTRKFLPVSVFREGTWRIGVYYAVPSAIYAVYNNLTFYNLRLFDAGTYQVFMQTRILFTGVLYVYLLQRPLTGRKWAALVLLTVGVASKYISSSNFVVDPRIVFMLFQASLSAFAGVYNEYLLKRDITMDINEQNFFMYSFALLFNLGFGLLSNPTYYTSGDVFASMNGIFLLIVINGATLGIVTSLILKFINVIVKAFASAAEVILTAVAAYLLLDEALTSKDVVACAIVMGSIYVYYTQPAPAPTTTTTTTSAGERSSLVDGGATGKA